MDLKVGPISTKFEEEDEDSDEDSEEEEESVEKVSVYTYLSICKYISMFVTISFSSLFSILSDSSIYLSLSLSQDESFGKRFNVLGIEDLPSSSEQHKDTPELFNSDDLDNSNEDVSYNK